MKLFNHFLGGVLLVSGTSIGAGMLALPAATATAGFFPSLVVFFFCWLFMLATAFFFLHINLALPGEPNIITMAEKTLGVLGKGIAWILYLLLLYSLVAAYIAGCTPLIVSGIHYVTGYTLSPYFAPFILPVFCSVFLYFGTAGVDYVNRFLMVGLIVAFGIGISSLPSHVQKPLLDQGNWGAMWAAVPILIVTFGYHIIIPTLTTYIEHKGRFLRLTLIFGSVIPLIIYLIWQFLVLGSVPSSALLEAMGKGESATAPLAALLRHGWISTVINFFAFFAITTSFLGVSLSLSDFLVDGLKLKKGLEGRLIAIALTFVPPLFFVFTFPEGFYIALRYAGAFVALLLGALPTAMVWTLKERRFYQTGFGRVFLVCMMALSIGIVVLDVISA